MKKFNGFTLIELMVTIAVLATVLTIAIPSFRDMVANNRTIAQANKLVGMLNMARSEAQKKSRNVLVCASDDQATCSGANTWENGWIVQVTGGGDIIQQKIALEGDITVRGANFTNAGTGQVQFDRLGTVDSSGNFVICDYRGNNEARAVNVELSGFVRKATDDDGGGIVNDIAGNDVACP